MGLQDSYNLAWKIAMVLKGTAPLSLIDSYNDERTPIADEIIQLSSKNLNFFVSESYWFFQARKFGLALLSYLMPYLPTGSGGPTFAMVCHRMLCVLFSPRRPVVMSGLCFI